MISYLFAGIEYDYYLHCSDRTLLLSVFFPKVRSKLLSNISLWMKY